MASLGHCVHCNFELPKPVEFCPECGQRQVRLAKPRVLAAGTSLSESFVIGAESGDDGMSTTHTAEQASLGRKVQLRTLHDGLDADPVVVKRFLAEVRKVGRLHHPATVPVLAAGLAADGTPWVATEDPGERTLAMRLAEKKPIPRAWAMGVLRQVGELLEQAHDEGIVHGALDPSRVHVSERGEHDVVKVTDLGVVSLIEQMARRADVKVKPATAPEYLAPERGTNAPDARADIFALGVLAKELLAASGPLPAGAEAAIETATQPHPGDRPSSPLKLVEMLEASLSVSPLRPMRASGGALPAGAEGSSATVRMAAMPAEPPAGPAAEKPGRAKGEESKPAAAPKARPARPLDEDELALRGGARPASWVLLAGGAVVGAIIAAVITALAVGGGSGKDRDRSRDDKRDDKAVAALTAKAADSSPEADAPKKDDAPDPAAAKADDTAAAGTDEPAPSSGTPPASAAAGSAAPSAEDAKALADLKAAVGSGFLGAAHAAAARIGADSPLRKEADDLLVKARTAALKEAIGAGKTPEAREHLAWLEEHVADGAPAAAEIKKLEAKIEALEEKESKLAAAAPPPAPAPAPAPAKVDKPAKVAAKPPKPARVDKPTKVARTDPDPTPDRPATAAALAPRDPLAPKGVPKALPKPAGIPTVKPKPKLGG